jgi:predicted porin
MNKYIIGLVVVSATLGAEVAHAQNTITLYGRVAAGLDFVNNVATSDGGSHNLYRYGSNQYGPSWFGLKGDEDLGGRWHAVFNLESQFSSGTGQLPDQNFWNRYAYVGISHDNFGSLWLGRAMSLTDETSWYIDPIGSQKTGLANLSKGRAWGSTQNAVTFNSIKYNGFSFRLQNSLSNQVDYRASRQYSVSAMYTGGAFAAYGVYDERRDANGKFSNLFSASREYEAGATYQIESVKFYLGYQQLVSSGQDTVPDAKNPNGANRSQQEWVGVNYQVTPFLRVAAAYYHGNVNHGGGNGNLGAIGAWYNLSKRTMLYATAGAMFNGGIANYGVEVNDALPLAGHNQQGGYFGVLHYF